MSDAPDQKVEDVLSSVRRLVSNEVPRKPRAGVPSEHGALVLTKDHMVPVDRARQAPARSLEDRIAELEEAVGSQDDEFEPDGSEDQDEHRPDRIVYRRSPDLDDPAGRKTSRRLSQISMVETGPVNGESDTEKLDGAISSEPDVAEFRRQSQILPATSSGNSDSKINGSGQPDQNHEAPKTDVEAPMAEDVPTVARASAEVTAFSDPDDVVRTFEARIEAGRPMSDPSPLRAADPMNDAKIAQEKLTQREAKLNAEAVGDAPEDFDTALSNAVAASISGLGQGETEGAAQQDYLDANEFDGTSDTKLTAAQLLSGVDATNSDTKLETSEPLVLGDAQASPQDDGFETPDGASRTIDESDPSLSTDAVVDKAQASDAASDKSETKTPEGSPDQVAAALANIPDEEAMRLLIARMIRAELQGDLGEQITRNVRKLVRREIKRALSADDLT